MNVLLFALKHADLIAELASALARGATKEALMRSIRAAAVAASDTRMRAELGGPR